FATAQNPLERARQRAENRTQENVNQKVDRTVDDAIDNLFGRKKKKPSNKKQEAPDELNPYDEAHESSGFSSMLESMLGGGEWTPYENPKSFSYAMEVTTTKKNGKSESLTVEVAVLSSQVGIVTKQEGSKEQSRLILNTQDGKTTIISTDNKGKSEGYRIRMPNISGLGAPEAENESDNPSITVKRTGEKKSIDGYQCEKIIVTNPEDDINMVAWVTNDIQLSMMDIMQPLLGIVGGGQMVSLPKATTQPQDIDGFIILATQTDKKGVETEIHYRQIRLGAQTDASLLDVSDVEVQDLGR
ncbi:MAG: DUF4412 domain-containing protein, partial [Schleiferiaceae bacterium]|nr:DUF4412 domain-containing protein [Schleiferiaceae bacterium]